MIGNHMKIGCFPLSIALLHHNRFRYRVDCVYKTVQLKYENCLKKRQIHDEQSAHITISDRSMLYCSGYVFVWQQRVHGHTHEW
jgi:hypothetical protein